ncbi:MAG: hypothetical protein AB1758_20310 [Candidatus Eremiobacterota bacterium]
MRTLLAIMNLRLKPRDLRHGSVQTAMERSLPKVYPEARQASHPANRLLAVQPPRTSVRRLLLRLANSTEGSRALESHAISGQSLQALLDDDADRFIEARAALLKDLELQFMHEAGIQPPLKGAGPWEDIVDTD